MLTRIASHGFIVVGPQVREEGGACCDFSDFLHVTEAPYDHNLPHMLQLSMHITASTVANVHQSESISHVPPPLFAQMFYDVAVNKSSADDFKESARIITWLHSRLASSIRRHLPSTASSPDWSSFFIGGHSWGGKLSFGVAQSIFAPLPIPLQGLIGFDPVDGLLDSPIVSPMVRHSPRSVNVHVPALIMAAGLGPVPAPGLVRACAPAYFGPPSFFSDSEGPTVYFNLTNHGHVDFCDDPEWKASWDLCTPGASAAPMRAAAAGLAVAFIKGVLSKNYTDLEAVYNSPNTAPASMSDLQVYPSALPWT